MTTESGASEALRDILRGSTDPRVSRTRAALVAAVQSLAEAEAEVSVSAIVREAGISRASFYSHFSGLDELAMSLHREAFTAIADLVRLDKTGGPDAVRRSQERLVAHFAENRALYSAVAALPTSKESHLAGVRDGGDHRADTGCASGPARRPGARCHGDISSLFSWRWSGGAPLNEFRREHDC